MIPDVTSLGEPASVSSETGVFNMDYFEQHACHMTNTPLPCMGGATPMKVQGVLHMCLYTPLTHSAWAEICKIIDMALW